MMLWKAGDVIDLPSGRYEIMKDIHAGDSLTEDAMLVDGEKKQAGWLLPPDAVKRILNGRRDDPSKYS